MRNKVFAKIDSVCLAHHEWQRGAINETEYLRQADIDTEQHKEIEQRLTRFSAPEYVRERVTKVLLNVR